MEEGGSSPFKPPNDEEVFLTRETEKQKKKEAKEKAKNMKIWDKKTASNRAPLRRVRDNDIEIPGKKDNTALITTASASASQWPCTLLALECSTHVTNVLRI